ncbi:fibrinogen-like protein A [Musca vetustissima]|uniref:fibrinogen-like protein A n=1 Tax=Musca vetustissima TaxID=27455 RepID=UPI002AB6E2A3|nr:fibrinogen-like protein A [Musca vetustissima]
MKLLGILLVLCVAQRAFGEDNSDLSDPVAFDNDEVLWHVLYTKLNLIMNVTDTMSDTVMELQNKQREQEDRTMQLIEKLNTDAKQYMDEQFKELSERQYQQETKLTHLVEKIDEYFSETNKRFDDLTSRQDNQENLIVSISNQTQAWTTVMRRQDGSVDFYRKWAEYKSGFGNPPNGEFFIGLDNLHRMTSREPMELLVVMHEWGGDMVHAHYDLFRIGGEYDKYAIKVLGNYSGDAGDGLGYHLGMPFSTYDQDNDESTRNCASYFRGAWWFKSCYSSHLCGPYRFEANANQAGVSWDKWKVDYSFRFAEMKIRPKLVWSPSNNITESEMEKKKLF